MENLTLAFENNNSLDHALSEQTEILNAIKEKINTITIESKFTVYKLPEKTALGTCLNFGVNKSNYNIIAKFDDDDYYGPYYLDEANKAFLREGCYVLGKQKTYYYLEQYKKLLENVKEKMDENKFNVLFDMEVVGGIALRFYQQQ